MPPHPYPARIEGRAVAEWAAHGVGPSDAIEGHDGRPIAGGRNARTIGVMRILAVDDDRDIRDFYRSFLREAGHEALVAADGPEALRLALHHPDAIVLDLGLPEMNGYEVLARLRADPATRDIPVIIVTAYPLARGVDLAGVAGVLRKPYDVPLLALTLERAVAGGEPITR